MFYLKQDLITHLNQLPFPDKLLNYVPSIYTDLLKVLIMCSHEDPLEMFKQDHEIFMKSYLAEFIRENSPGEDEQLMRLQLEGNLQKSTDSKKSANLKIFQFYERIIKSRHLEKQFSKMIFNLIKQQVPSDNFLDFSKMRFLALITLAMFFLPKAQGKNIDVTWQLLFDRRTPKKSKVLKLYKELSNLRGQKKVDAAYLSSFGFGVFRVQKQVQQRPPIDDDEEIKKKLKTEMFATDQQLTEDIEKEFGKRTNFRNPRQSDTAFKSYSLTEQPEEELMNVVVQ